VNLSKAQTLVLPLRSTAFFPKKISGLTPQELPATLENDYRARCARESSLATESLVYSIHMSDIPELDSISTMEDVPFVTASSCSKPSAIATKGNQQIQGEWTLQLKAQISNPEDSDRKLYHLTLPLEFRGGYRDVENTKLLYQQACDRLRGTVNQSSTVLAYCVEPTVEYQCCGNVRFVGEFHALVFAYTSPTLQTVTNTGKDAFEIDVKNASYLSDQHHRLSANLALAFCTAPSFEYAPTMAFQSRCYSLEQTFKSASPDLVRCRANNVPVKGDNATVWASHKLNGTKHSLRVAAKTSRFTQQNTDEANFHQAAAGDELSTTDGVTLQLAPGNTTATLRGASAHLEGAPAEIQMQCEKF
jgi:hypothetical protein